MKELQETATMMCSKDRKERFAAEYIQLRIRTERLETMIKKWDDGTLDFAPCSPRSSCELQLRAMHQYLSILELRAEIEGVKI